MYTTVLGNALSGRGMAGVVLWMVAARTYPDYDSFTCRLPGTEDPAASCDDRAAVAEVLRFTQSMLELNDEQNYKQAPTAAL